MTKVKAEQGDMEKEITEYVQGLSFSYFGEPDHAVPLAREFTKRRPLLPNTIRP